MTAAPVPGFIYARQSKTRDGSESLDIQVEACREAAARLGIDVVGEYVEPPSTSGYKNRGRNRAKFAEMLAAVRAGEARAIMVYKSERLSRGGGPGWAPVFDALDGAGLNADRAVATPNGWMSEFEIGIRATMDREESKKLADRMADVRAREARAGRVRSGGKRPFGFDADGVTVRPAEAELIAEAARRVLEGQSPWGVAEDWNRRGVTGPGGGHWAAQTLKRVLRSGRVAGLREHLGAVVAEAEWPAILDRETWERVTAAMDANPSRHPVRQIRARTFPLTGIIRCGRCGEALWGRTRNGGRREYACSGAQTHAAKSCGSLVVFADAVEEDVLRTICTTLTDEPTFKGLLDAVAPSDTGAALAAELSELEDRRARLLDMFEQGDIAKPEYRERMVRLTADLDASRAALAAAAGKVVIAGAPTDEAALREAWATKGIEWQRLVIDAVIEHVEVAPGRAASVTDRLSYRLR